MMANGSREERSKAMFGTKDAYDVFGIVSRFAIDPPETFTVKDVRGEYLDPRAVSVSSIRRNLHRLEALEAVERTEGTYRRINPGFWENIQILIDGEIERSLES